MRSAGDGARPAAGDAGWLLVDMLVGLVLLALIAVLLASALRTARGTLAAAERHAGEATVEAVHGYLGRAIAQARLARLPGAAPEAPLIEAGRTSLRFVTDYAPAGQYGGLYALSLELEPGPRAGLWSLVEVRTLYRPAAQPGTPEPPRPHSSSRLLAGIAGIAFSFHGVREEAAFADTAAWGTEWTDPVRLPQLIAIDVAFAPGDPRAWPRLIIAVPAGQP